LSTIDIALARARRSPASKPFTIGSTPACYSLYI
jgi:hypothetical protein